MLPGPMRRLTSTTLLALLALVVVAGGCAGSDATPATTSSTTTSTPVVDEALAALLLERGDLPGGFTESAQVDDTVTTFCAAEDAAAGLRATAREVRGFADTSSGTSVIQLVFRFAGDGARQFVDQAGGALERCDGVPDLTGLAFEYEPLGGDLNALLDRPDAAVGRHGVNVGSGSLSINVIVVQHGDVGELIAVLGVDLPRAALDALALRSIGAALDKL